MDYKLTFEQHADGVCKKPVSGQSFNVNSTFIKMFYSCFIKLVFMFTFMCWFGSHSFRNKNLLQNIVKVFFQTFLMPFFHLGFAKPTFRFVEVIPGSHSL